VCLKLVGDRNDRLLPASLLTEALRPARSKPSYA
jgi:hypothetical protein